MDYKERSTVWKTDHVLAVCDDITRASSLEYIFTRNCPLPFCPYSNCGSSHSCRRRRGHSDRGVEYSRVFPHWWKGSFGQVAQFLAVCSRLKWSRHWTKSPCLAPLAMTGSSAAYKIISACSNAVS